MLNLPRTGFLLALGCGLAGWSVAASTAPPPRPAADTPALVNGEANPPHEVTDRVTFIVWWTKPRALLHRGESELQPVSGADVLLGNGANSRSLGRTDKDGWITVDRATLRENRGAFIIVCAPRLECGAVPVTEEGLLESHERLVVLTPRVYR